MKIDNPAIDLQNELSCVSVDATSFSRLLADIEAIIKEARSAAYAGINAVQIDHNWKIGRRIVEEEQGGRVRAEYGKRTIAELSANLCAEFGEGYSERNLRDFRAFYVVFPDREIWHTRVPYLSWSHFRLIMRVTDPTAREWYINEASNEELTEEVARQKATLMMQFSVEGGGK